MGAGAVVAVTYETLHRNIEPMIDVKQAARAAEAFVRALIPESGLRDVRLEEVDLSDDGGAWDITLGWADPGAAQNALFFNPAQSSPRVYKTLRVDGTSGEVTSMKIRSVR